MSEFLMLMAIVFSAYLFMPTTWFSKLLAMETVSVQPSRTMTAFIIPEDSVLRRHFVTQLRSEIELQMPPRPTDATLQRHYDALVNAELESRLTQKIG